MIWIKTPANPARYALKYLILEPPRDAGRERLVIRSAREATEIQFSLDMDYDSALRLRDALTAALDNMKKPVEPAKTDIQVRF